MKGRTASARRCATPVVVGCGAVGRGAVWVTSSPWVGPGEGQLRDVDVAAREASLRVREVEVPHPHEELVEAERVHGVALRQEPAVPPAQRLGVVAAHLELLGEPEGGLVAGDLVDHLDARQEAAGEDVLVDPGLAVAGGEHPVVRHRDRLDGDAAAGGEDLVDRLEVGAPELVADGLDHLDGQHGVVRRPGRRRARGSPSARPSPGRRTRPRRSAARRARAARSTG